MKYKAIVFDFDGTLANLTIDFEKIKKKILVLADIFIGKVEDEIVNYPLLELIEILTDKLKETSTDLAKEFNTRCRLLLVDMEIRSAEKGQLFPFTLDVLSKLKEKNISIGVITRNCAFAVKKVFPDIDKFVSVFLPREDVKKVKPNSYHLLYAIEKLGVDRDLTLMVGDHPMDIICGKNAGVDVCAVYSGRTSSMELQKYKPKFLCKDISYLYNQLSARNLI